MAHLLTAPNLAAAFQMAIAAVAGNGARIAPRGIQTRELNDLVLEIETPHDRFVRHPSLHYPLIVLKQLKNLCGPFESDAVECYEVPAADGAHSAAHIFDDLEQIPTRTHLEQLFMLLAADASSRAVTRRRLAARAVCVERILDFV